MSNRLLINLGVMLAVASTCGVLFTLSSAPPSTLNQNGALELWRWLYISTAGMAVSAVMLVTAAHRGEWLADVATAGLTDEDTIARAAGRATAAAVPRAAATTARRFVLGKPIPHDRVQAYRAPRDSSGK